MKKKILGIITLLFLSGALIFYGLYERIKRYGDRLLAIQQERLFTLPAGTRQIALVELLVKQQLVDQSIFLLWLMKIEPELGQFKAGTYRLVPGMTLRQMLLLLHSGKEAQFSIRFVEGSRLQDWLEKLQTSPYIKHGLKGKSIQQVSALLCKESTQHVEGWLYPDTYLYTAGTLDLAILQRAHRRMNTMLTEIWAGRKPELPYKTPKELLIMASIIEKETGVAAERAKVASVFINRLQNGMRLQTDPTVIYGLGEKYNGNITRQDLTMATPYNTYVIDGLPPTPIAMPGRASLEAAAHPADTDFFYFVADGQGGHVFTTNLQSHNQAVRDYLKRLRQKSG